MELTEFASLQLPEQINLPFSISCSGEYHVVSAKGNVEILRLKYKHINEDATLNYCIDRIESSKLKPTGRLATKETILYNSSTREERTKLQLDQTIIPNVATLYTNNIMAVASPPGILQDYASCLMSHLTNLGQLMLHRYDKDSNEWISYVDISAVWMAHIYDNRIILTFDRLQTLVQEALMTAFSWRNEVYHTVAYLAVGTKSGKVAIFSLYSDNAQVRHVASVPDAIRTLKWITIAEDRNLLLAGLLNGKIAAFSFRTLPDATVVDFVQLADVWADEDSLTVCHIQYEIDLANERILILAVKGTHLLVFTSNLHGEIMAVAIQNMNNFMITGVQQLSSYCYVVCTLAGSIFCVEIKVIKGDQLVIELNPIKNDLNISKFSIYGVTTTKNRSCWLFLCYPSKSFDRLSLRTPTVVVFCTFSGRDSLNILLENPSLRMTEYYDCAEVIRFSGNRNIETLSQLEALASTRPSVDDAYAYHLKMQLIQLGARLSYFKKRCQSIAEVLFQQSQFVAMVIEILHAAKVIYYFMFVRQSYPQLSYPQLLTIRCLRNFIKEFVDDSFPGDFEHVHLSLKSVMEEVLAHASDVLSSSPQQPYYEECSFCGEAIADTKQTCSENHQTFRCSLTKQQIPVRSVETMCAMCDRSSLDVELLGDIFYSDGGHLSIYYRYCCVCDLPFEKRVVL
ncbi:uncharacterized protein LOC131692432 [Topomyia yanbarensis]|uniref:uncharacterized protein LOC131692432 n=1 Tax=Topomyia yanbarensis TaxID=2498891 RepID=UPI00273AFAE2|nr:uncharacterized protein LOC131692432 [Topomyia yanbarensis]XP_058835460.1 uncharacterized protein LOC131692432 [Topomyia yanbarensis]XP_058835461.1 uncharacterized protein LOC131692432 [Topomyia yanbarensis]XP_058835462.1 uncharacterized protein LOC131692432 [Topomyia yanbarensis]